MGAGGCYNCFDWYKKKRFVNRGSWSERAYIVGGFRFFAVLGVQSVCTEKILRCRCRDSFEKYRVSQTSIAFAILRSFAPSLGSARWTSASNQHLSSAECLTHPREEDRESSIVRR